MLLIVILSVLSFFLKDKSILHQKNQFDIVVSQNRKISLLKTNKCLSHNSDNQKNWYYIHFYQCNLSKISQYIPINPTDMIIKNTFILFLSTDQLSMISNISFAKKFEPNDKYSDSIEKLAQSKYLLVIGSQNFVLEQNSKFFTIYSKIDSYSYLIKPSKSTSYNNRYLIRTLSENPLIRTISIYNKPVLKNSIYAGYTQRNTRNINKDAKTGLYYTERYLNAKGLTGEGQIVTVVDTPIDFQHSMFYDPNSTFEVKKPLNHRKFVYYHFEGTVDELRAKILNKEHGTHVAGTIAGESICGDGYEIMNGNAPKSKLIYFKLNSYSNDMLIEKMAEFGSRISSNSWDYMGYDDEGNYAFSLLALNNPDIAFIFSAGNEYQGGNFTVDDPSGSKNILAVGAIDDFFEEVRKMRFQSKKDASFYIDGEEIQMYDPFYTGVLGTDVNKSDIVIVNVEEVGDCELFEIDRLFLIYASTREKAAWVKKCYVYPSKGVLLSVEVEKVQAFLEHSKSSLVTAFDITQINNSKPVNHAYFSSGGPANKGIIKPDVMAPGRRIFSAKSIKNTTEFHGCADNVSSCVSIKEGTSQAAPNVAGAAALISQYFMDGFWKYPSVTLDGPTLRALLINSCVHPQRSKTPDILFGHGVIDLSTLLPFDGEFGLQITNRNGNNSIGQNGHKVAFLNVLTKKKDLQITLSYLDTVLYASSSIPIVHNLDLVVTSPSGKEFKGDNIEGGDSQHLSTNEKVIIDKDELETGNYTIHIYTGSFIDSEINSKTQNFSVVATGGIESGYLNFNEAENCGYDKCDDAIPLHKKCDNNSIGPICQGQISTQKIDNFTMTLRAHEIKRISVNPKNFLYTLNTIKKISVVALNMSEYSSVWIDKKCRFELGEFESMIGKFSDDSELNADVGYKSSTMCIAIFNNNYEEATFSVSVTRNNRIYYYYIAAGCVAAVLLIIIIIVVVVKSRRSRERNGFTEIKSLN